MEIQDTYLDSNNIVLSRKYAVTRHNLINCRCRPVEDQAAGIDRPLECRASHRKSHQLVCLAGDSSHIKRQVGHDALKGLVTTARASDDSARTRGVRGAAIVIPNDCRNVVDVVDGRAVADPATSQPVVARIGIGLDDDINALSD